MILILLIITWSVYLFQGILNRFSQKKLRKKEKSSGGTSTSVKGGEEKDQTECKIFNKIFDVKLNFHIYSQAKEKLKNMLSYRKVPELEELLKKTEFEMEGKTVSILELDVSNFDEKLPTIGSNRVEYEGEEEAEEEKKVDNSNKIVTKKSIKQAVKKMATIQMQKSKVFQKKQMLERVKNKKDSRRKTNANKKILKKKGKGKKR